MGGFLNRMIGTGERRSIHPRDPALVDWLYGGGARTATGISVTPDNARQCPEVDACVGLIEDTIATVPLDFFERTGDGSRERRDDHPLHALLHDTPNSWQTSAEFRQMMEGWRSTHGNAYARIVTSGLSGFPSALEPIPPAQMQPFRVPGGVAYRWTPDSGSQRVLLQNEVLHLKDSPFKASLVEGESKVTRHRETIGRALAIGEYISRFFSNYAVPKAFLEVPGVLDKEGAELLRDQFEARHAGLENSHRIGVLMAGMKLNSVGVDNDAAKTIETYSLAVSQVARIWDIPLHLIGEMTKATSWGTGIEQQSIGFVVYAMRPKFVIWEQALNAALMSSATRRNFFFEFNVDGLLRGDFKTRMEGFALMVQWGLATPNEIRRLMNLPPVADGNERLHPINYAPASRIMDVLMRNKTEPKTADDATRMLASIVKAANEGRLQDIFKAAA